MFWCWRVRSNNRVSSVCVRWRTAELDLKECFGERFTVLVLMRGALVGEGVLLNESLSGTEPLRSPETAGSTATAPGRAPGIFFLFEGGMRDEGKEVGRGSFSIVRYTRCMAFEDTRQIHNYYVHCSTWLVTSKQGSECFLRKIKEIIAKIAAAHHSEFLFVQLPIFVNITQIPDLQDTNVKATTYKSTVNSKLSEGSLPRITFPNTSRGSLELIKTGLTLSPESRPFTGDRLSKMPSNFPFSSDWRHGKII